MPALDSELSWSWIELKEHLALPNYYRFQPQLILDRIESLEGAVPLSMTNVQLILDRIESRTAVSWTDRVIPAVDLG